MRFLRLALLLTLLILSGCATSRHGAGVVVKDPNEDVFRSAVNDYLSARGAPLYSAYEYTRTDLDGDGRRDAIVLFTTPYHSWCNKDGCEAAIFKAQDDHFNLVGKMNPVRGPLMVSNTKTNGWKDIIIRVSGRAYAPKNVAMRFNGTSYPQRPEMQPAMQIAANNVRGLRILP